MLNDSLPQQIEDHMIIVLML